MIGDGVNTYYSYIVTQLHESRTWNIIVPARLRLNNSQNLQEKRYNSLSPL